MSSRGLKRSSPIAQRKRIQNKMCDDVFDDFGEEQIVSNKTWNKIVENTTKDGYREGLEAGQEESLQTGFNDAFSVSSQVVFQVAELRGRVSGKLSLNLMKPGYLEADQELQLQSLLQDVLTFETEMLTFSQTTFLEMKQKNAELSEGNHMSVIQSSSDQFNKNEVSEQVDSVEIVNDDTDNNSDKAEASEGEYVDRSKMSDIGDVQLDNQFEKEDQNEIKTVAVAKCDAGNFTNVEHDGSVTKLCDKSKTETKSDKHKYFQVTISKLKERLKSIVHSSSDYKE